MVLLVTTGQNILVIEPKKVLFVQFATYNLFNDWIFWAGGTMDVLNLFIERYAEWLTLLDEAPNNVMGLCFMKLKNLLSNIFSIGNLFNIVSFNIN
ncbi:hypothetical protein Syun_030547 [Stephania yunnanensis]|uniref:Uncharacterized protein n=1 Tax=Stephania yunnanensis TaxID=152371 RepID=A0AAP0DUC0_9MAGN